jgi:hypothetical protein
VRPNPCFSAICLAVASLAIPQDRPADIRVDVDLVPLACSVTDHNVQVNGLQTSEQKPPQQTQWLSKKRRSR